MSHLPYLAFALLLSSLTSFCASPPSIEDLFKSPRLSTASLSLDGLYFAALYSDSDQTSLMTLNLQTKQAGRTAVAEYCDVYDYHWASNETIIYEISRRKQWAEAVGVVGRNLQDAKTLIENRPVTVVDGLVHDKEHALLWLRNAPDDNMQSEDLRVVNIVTGRFGEPQANFPGRVLEWYTDMCGFPRLARAYRKGCEGREDFYFRSAIHSSWQRLEFNFQGGFDVYGFAPDGQHLYMSGYTGKNTASLFMFDLQKAAISGEIYNDSNLDFDGKLYFFSNPYFSDKVSLKGFSYPDSTVWLDTGIAGIQHDVDSRLQGTKNKIVDADTRLSRFLIASSSDVQPILYFVYDVPTRTIFPVSSSMPWINPGALCPVRQISFVTSDSLRLFGYLTTPKDLKPPYPTVVLLHGGPNDRDYCTFDPEVQLLATRGYAVLQVNYRGSLGFGKKVSYENRFEYLKMHQDVKEATSKSIRAGIIDSNRVAIMGTSFGGYLAICGAAFDPDMYSCAITNAGVFDWEMQWEHFKDYGNRRYYDELQGLILSKHDSKDFLKDASPVHCADRIKIPVLIAGGREDERVPLDQSRKLERAMKKSGNDPITFYKWGETHGFHYEANRIKYYENVLSFLNANIDKTKRKKK
jgi:dipeptidyl aminopeptidase/acylaminoacyl peptidase